MLFITYFFYIIFLFDYVNFIAIFRHDLRTPLSSGAILSTLSGLLHETAGTEPFWTSSIGLMEFFS